jgi:hypothetical protein
MARQMCQSCGMPLKDNNRGTEANGDTSEKYCTYCYREGEFTWKDATADQMQIYCTGILMKKHWPGFMAKFMTHNIPKLDRWSKA